MTEKSSWRDYLKDYLSTGGQSNKSNTSSGGWRDHVSSAVTGAVGNDLTKRVNAYLDDYNTFVTDYQNRFSGRKGNHEDAYVSDSGEWAESIKNRKSAFDAEYDSILSYLDQYSKYLDAGYVLNVKETLLKTKSNTNKMLNASIGDKIHWDQWKDADAYKASQEEAAAYAKQYEEQEALKNFDLVQGKQELDRLLRADEEMSEVSQLYFSVQNGVGDFSQEEKDDIVARYQILTRNFGTPTELSQKIADKKAYYGRAERLQEGIRLASVADPNSENYDPEFYKYTDMNVLAGLAFDWDDFLSGIDNKYDNLGFMTEKEKKLLYYYGNKFGLDAANKYYDSIEETLNARRGKKMFERVENNVPLELLFGVNAGLNQFTSGLGNLFSTEDYIPTSAVQYASGLVREDLGDVDLKYYNIAEGKWDDATIFGNSLGQGIYDTTTTTFNMAPSILASVASEYVLPGSGAAVGSTLMGASAAGNAYQTVLNQGYGKAEARVYSTAVGVSEATLQYLLGGVGNLGGTSAKITKAVAGIDNGILRFALQYGGQMASEGLEEGLQEILDPILQNAILGTDEDVNWSEVAYSALLGGLSAGLLEGPSTFGNVASDQALKKRYGSDTDALIQEGLGNDVNSESYKFAQEYKARTDGGKKITGPQLRNLLTANDMSKIQKAAENRLTELGQTENVSEIAELAAKYATGQELTRAEKKILANSEFGAQVAKELKPDSIAEWAEGIGTRLVNAKAYNKSQIKKLREELTKPATYKSLEERVGTEAKSNVSKTGNATIRGTNETIDLGKAEVTDFVKDKNGNIVDMTLEVDGKKVKASEIDYADGDQSYLFSAVSQIENITPGDATAFVRGYDPSSGLSVGEYLNGIDEAYTYGYHNYSEADMNSGKFTQKLSSEKANGAYRLGQVTRNSNKTNKAEAIKRMRTAVEAEAEKAKAEGKEAPKAKGMTITYNEGNGKVVDFDKAGVKLTTKQKAAPAIAKVMHEMGLGTNFELFSSYVNKDGVRVFLDENGVEQEAYSGVYRMKDGTIRIDLNAYNGRGLTLNAMAHELTHFIQQWSTEKYDVLTDFLMKTYEKTDMSMHDRVLREQARLERIRGEKISYDEAYDEVVANAMSKMLDDGNVMERLDALMAVDMNLAEKLWEGLNKLLKKFFNVYKNESALFYDAADLMDLKAEFEQMQKMWADAFVEASENFQASITPGVEGTAYTQSGEVIAHSTEDGSVQLSMHTYDTDGRNLFRKYLEKCVSSKQLTKTEMQEMLDGIEEIYNVCKEFKDKYVPFGTWSDAAVVRDTYGKPVFSVVTPNGEYKMNLDFSLVCKKRRTLDAVFNEMSKRGIIDNFELGQKSVVKINEIIRKHGFETACALCFVDAKRFRQASMADSFTNLYNELVRSLVPESERGSIDYFNFAGYDTIKNSNSGIDTWDSSKLDFSHIDYVLKNYAKGTVEHKAAKYIKNNPEARRFLLRGDFMSSGGFDAVKSQNKTVLSLYNSKKGTGGPKAAFGDVQYMNEIIQKAKSWTPAKAYDVGGVRIQSFSDYVPRMVFDYVQMVYDLAATKLPAHAYTKEALFVKQFGLTGIKINMSLIPAIAKGGVAPGLDANGNYVWAGESFDFETAKEIQNADGYTENCGTICVGVSDLHIRKLLADPDIRMVIPYHKSGLNPVVAHMNRIAEFTDYTGSQNTLDRNGKKLAKDFEFDKALHKMGENADPKAVVEEYLNWCDTNGYTPKFSQFRDNANYYKLIEDFTLFDKNGKYVPQRGVQAVFPADGSAFGSMKSLIEAGLQEDAVIEGKRDSSLSSIVDEIQQTLPKTEAEIAETEVEQADHDLEAGERLSSQQTDADYMDAVNRGDMDTVQKMVDAAAKAAGYVARVFHGTKQFGFTKFDTSFSDDKITVFATPSNALARSYSGVGGKRAISDKAATVNNDEYVAENKNMQEKLQGKIDAFASEVDKYYGKKGFVKTDDIANVMNQYAEAVYKGKMSEERAEKKLEKYIQKILKDGYDASMHNGESFKSWEQTLDYEKLVYKAQSAFSTAMWVAQNTIDLQKAGNYDLYANIDNFLVIDGKGASWNELQSDVLPDSTSAEYKKYNYREDGKWKTRSIAKYALDKGYSGVLYKNILDVGPSGTLFNSEGLSEPTDVYAFFHPESQLKSADPVTYDKKGRVIPLSERFNTKKDDIRYSTQETDNISNRDLLANAFEGITKDSVEYKEIQKYKSMVATLNKLDQDLAEVNAEIRKIRFETEGARDMEALRKLEEKADRIAKDINKHDKILLSLEASEPLRKVIERERKKEAQKTKEHVKEIQKNKQARAEQTELRHKIRKTVRDLDKILNRGNKKQNVKEDMKGFVSKALELADYLFTDHISNDDLIRKGITVRMTPREAALVKETEDILTQLYDNADSLTDEEFTRLDAKRKANEDKLRDLLTAQRNERLNTPVYNLFNDLVTEYASLKNAKQDAVKGAYDPKVEEFLRSYLGETTDGTDSDRKTQLQNMRVADMTTEELWKLHNAYTMVLHSVRQANSLFVKGKTETLEQMVGRIYSDFSKRKAPEGKVTTVIRNLSNKIGWDYEKLHYALDRIGSEAFSELVMNVADSENTVMQDVMEAAAFRDEIVKKYGFNNWDVNKKIDKEFLDTTGKKFTMTLGQLMSLYAYSRREGAWDHIKYGGFVFGEKELTNPKPADSYKLSKEQCEAITNTLTNEQKAYVRDMQKFLSETMGAKGNEVSMLLYGIKMFGEKNYFPIHIAGQFKAQANESQAKAAAGFSSMTNAGFTHAQNPNAKAPFVLEGFNEIWADHVNEMSRYHGTVPALEDMRRVMNSSSYSESTAESMSVKAMMENAFGQEAVDYFDSLYREANSGAIQDKLQRVPKKLLSLFRKNSVAYSLSVVIQQPSAMARAYAMIDKKYFGFKGVGALTSGVAKAVSSKWNPAYANTYNKMLKYAPGVTMAKEIGGFDTHTGTSIREYLLDTDKSFKQKWKTENLVGKGKAVMGLVDDNAIANLPTVADKIAWMEIWNACERETVAKHKDLATSSDEFLNIVGKRFTEVIRATQVYDSIFAKSPMLKSKNLAVQYLVSFMNEPNTTANMAEKAVRDVTKGDWKGGVRIAGAVTYSIIFNNVLKAIIYAMRDDDEDETYIEKYLAAVAGGMMDDFNPLNYVPVVRDVWSKAQGYDVERPDVAIISDAIDALTALSKLKDKDTENMTEEEIAELDKKMTEASWNLVGSLAAFFGVPVKNIYREIDGVIDHARIASKNAGMSTASSLWDKITEEVLGSIPFVSSEKVKTDKLYDAIVSGDAKYLERMKDTYKTDDAYTSAVRKALRENDPRIHEAAQARYDGNIEEYKRIFREIRDEGKFSFDDIMSAVNSEESKIRNGVEPDKVTSDYTANGYVEAIAMGNSIEAQDMMEDIIATKVANGKTQAEAEKEFKSDVATGIGNAYASGLLDETQAEKMLVEYAGKDEEEAASKVGYWSYIDAHPEYDQYELSESNVNDYLEFAEPAEIPMDVYVQFRDGTKDLKEIKDKWGDVEVTKREQVLDVIDSLPLTWKQKDALYLAAGYSEDKIWDVPW